MNELQTKLYEMLKWIVSYMDKNNLIYYVLGGTFLGAVRHGGFIPWDDDIDIGLPRDDYEKLINQLSTKKSHYIIESPYGNGNDFIYSYAKLYDLNTTLVEHTQKDIKRGICIDIFPIDGVGNTRTDSVRHYRYIDRLNMLLAMKTTAVSQDRDWWKNIAIIIGRLLPIKAKKLAQTLDKACTKRNYSDFSYVANCMSTYRSREIMEKAVFGEPREYKFEGILVKGPR